MLYLSQMLGKPVLDSNQEEIGRISDLAIQTGEVFPRITSLAFLGPSKTPFMVSWRKYVASMDDDRVVLNKPAVDIRFSYLQPDELLLARDLLNKQIVDTQGLKVVRVNDLKFSASGNQLRLLGAEVGARGILRGFSPLAERAVVALTRAFRRPLEEQLIAWNYMELVDRDLSNVKLAMTHKRLSELHPADVADILEQLNPHQRALVFDHLDKQQAAETFSELEDEYQTDIIDDLSEPEAADLLAQMDPDDAADILGDLPYEKKEKLLWLMGVSDQRRIRSLLGYREKTAGGIMTPEFVAVPEEMSVGDTIERLRHLDEDHESVHYVYTLDGEGRLSGALSLRSLVLAAPEASIYDLTTRDLITARPEDDQEDVAEAISKYDLLALPVVDENGKLLGIVTIDDAMDVLEEEHTEDLQIAGASSGIREEEPGGVGFVLRLLARRMSWFILWVVIAFMMAMSGWIHEYAGALVLMPFVLLIAETAVTFATRDLINYGGAGSGRALIRLLGRNALVAALVAVIGVLIYLVLQNALTTLGGGAIAQSIFDTLLAACLPAVLAATVVLLLSTLITVFGRRQLDRDKELSSAAITVFMMIVAVVVQFGLTKVFFVAF